MIVMSSSLFMAHVTRRTDPCRFCFFFSGIKLVLKLIAMASHMTTLMFCITIRCLLLSIVILHFAGHACSDVSSHHDNFCRTEMSSNFSASHVVMTVQIQSPTACI